MRQRTFIRHAQAFRDCSHAAEGRRKGFKSRKAACPSWAGSSVGPRPSHPRLSSRASSMRLRREAVG